MSRKIPSVIKKRYILNGICPCSVDFSTAEIPETANVEFIKMFLNQNFIVDYLNISILSDYVYSSFFPFIYKQEYNSLT